ncbi:hypothetical protein HMPREF9162_1189 [Selenomonas sp. oral taxon 137 str. F0430]|nr:hypothetical protein HMPREF9162_1189 [Selenomonas sp. oral taxon 137 str. F0430]
MFQKKMLGKLFYPVWKSSQMIFLPTDGGKMFLLIEMRYDLYVRHQYLHLRDKK